MSELENNPDINQTSAERISQCDKKDIINIELTDSESENLLIIDVDCDDDNTEVERLAARADVDVAGLNDRRISLKLEDVVEPMNPHRLRVELGDDYLERAEISEPLRVRNAFSIKPYTYAGIIILIFIVLSAFAIKVINNSTASTSPPVPSISEPVPVPAPNLSMKGQNITLQDAINAANDGDVISIQNRPYYGPVDFKGKNLSIVVDGNGSGNYAKATKVAVSGAVITLYEAEIIEPLLRSYYLTDDISGIYKKLEYKAQTNYYEFPAYPGVYLELTANGSNLVVSGKANAPNQEYTIAVDSGTYKGEYRTESSAGRLFSIEIINTKKQEGMRSETVMIDVFYDNQNNRTLNHLFSRLLVNLKFEDDQLVNAIFEKPLAYDGNARAWNTFRDPLDYLKAEPTIQTQDPRIIEMAASLVKPEMTDFQKLVVIHHWVTTNIAYDVKMLASGKRSPQDAVSVLESKLAVCEGYAKLMAAMLGSQGVSARYISGHAISSHDAGRGWEEEGLYNHPIGHAWNEIYIDGEWLTVDATWNAGYINSNSGEFVFEQGFNYFAPSLEYFSRSHFIPR